MRLFAFLGLCALCVGVASRAEAVSGVVYDAVSMQPVAGAQLSLVDDDSGAPVATERLGPGQQNQRTGSAGSYQFDPSAGHYRIVISAPPGYAFAVLPVGVSADAPFGARAVDPPNHLVSTANIPRKDETNPYYLRFHSAGSRGELRNNHLPLTPTRTQLAFTHSARLPRIQTGESAAFLIRIDNGSARSLPDPANQELVLDVALPKGFALQERDITVTDLTSGSKVAMAPAAFPSGRASGDDSFSLSGFTVPPGRSYEIRYGVSASVKPSNYAFTASLRAGAAEVVSPARAHLRVEADALFERSEMIGRVFCDDNRDGYFQAGESGLPRARIYLDNGSYAVSDDNGKYHFSNVAGGYHLAKVDPNSLPPGANATRSLRRDFHLTPGLPAKIDFGFVCKLERSRVIAHEVASQPVMDGRAIGIEQSPKSTAPSSTSVSGGTGSDSLMQDDAGGAAVTAPELFTVNTANTREVIVRGNLFGKGAVGADLKAALDAAVANGATAITVEVHSGAAVTADARKEQIQSLVEAGIAKRYLDAAGMKNIDIRGFGKSRPLVPPVGKKALKQNRRVVLRIAGGKIDTAVFEAPAMKTPPPPSVAIDGQPVKPGERSQFVTTATANAAPESAVGRGSETQEPAKSSSASSGEQSEVTLELPSERAEIKQDVLIGRAWGPAGSEILVNGNQRFAIGDDGVVTLEVPLSGGDNTLIFDVATASGKRGQLVRHYKMQTNRWFLLALGEGSFGQAGAQPMLPEADSALAVQVQGGDYFLHGRAALYFKGQVKGSGFFKDNKFTGYVDTAYAEQGTFLRNVVEPDKFYPVYGDTAAEVQDARQGKLYVLVEADASKLEGGNILTAMQGIELFRYDRALFGARVDWNRALSKYDHARLQGFVGQPLQASRRVHATMRGTGGSLYFLRDRDIVEGSEQIRFVVRDAVSGTVVEEGKKKRNVDYTIAYDTGRIVFMEPVSAYTQGSLAARLTPISVASGNAVYIEVDYEARDAGLGNQLAAGGYVKETLFGRITVGGGFVNERRGDGSRPDYRLYGGSVEVKPIDGVQVSAELNRSEGRDTDLAISADGGQSFAAIAKPETELDKKDGTIKALTGYAMKATAQLDFQKILNFPRELVTVSGYAARIDPNYYASNTSLEQGQVKFGVAAKGAVTKKDFLIARHDGVWSDLPVLDLPGYAGNLARRMNRQISAAGYEHVESTWDVGALYYHTFSDDSATSKNINTDTINLRGAYKLTPKLTLFGTQEFIMQGDPSIIQTTADHFATEIGMRYKLSDSLEAFVSEIVRYSGSNATQIGLRSAFGNDGRMYVSERFSRDLGGFTTTAIVGGDNAIARGSRAYGEYQMDAGGHGPQARAVYGLNNRWELVAGLYVGLLYERSQNTGTATGVGTGAASSQGGIPTQTPSYLGQGSGVLSRDRAYFNPSAILGLNVPVGIASRDAAAVSLEFLRLQAMKFTARVEMRFDNQDVRLNGADRLTLFTTLGLAIRLHRDLSFLGRLEWAQAKECGQGREIGNLKQMSLGLSYRPVKHDFFNALMKYTHRAFMRPLDQAAGSEAEVIDAFSVVPMAEIPKIRTQIVEKLAVKIQDLRLDQMAHQKTTTLLLINRVNFHVLKWLDISAEYRYKRSTGAADAQGGFLAELSVSPWDYLRIGAGYNFTHFSDDELADDRIDQKGFFIRAAAKY